MTPRLLISVAAAAAIGATVGGVSIANASGSRGAPTPSGKTPSVTSASSAGDPTLAHAAAMLGVTPEQLNQASVAVKRASAGDLTDGAVAAALAQQLHVSVARARAAFTYIESAAGTKARGQAAPEPDLTSLAAQLGITEQRAQWVYDQLSAMARPGQGVDPNSPAFAHLAAALGKTPTQLAQALTQWKMSLRPAPPSPAPSK